MKSLKNYLSKDNLINLLILSPALILVGYFVYFGIFWNVIVSLTNWESMVPPDRIIGFSIYFEDLPNDRVFKQSLHQNILLLIVFVPGTLIVGLLLAILLDQSLRGESIFRTILLFPFTISFVVTAYLWRWMYDAHQGVINSLFALVGLPSIRWIVDPNLVLISIIIALIWQFSGYTMLIFLAGIKSIPESHIMAAKVDGASGFTLYRRIIIPQLKGSAFNAFVVLMVFALKAFDFIYVLTMGGPGYSSYILPLRMFQQYAISNYNTAAAIADILLLLVMIVIIPYLYQNYRGKHSS